MNSTDLLRLAEQLAGGELGSGKEVHAIMITIPKQEGIRTFDMPDGQVKEIDIMAIRRQKQDRQQQQASTPAVPDWLAHINAVETRLTNRIDRLFFAILGAGGGIIIALIGLIAAIILKG